MSLGKLLIPFGKIYGRAMDLRNRLYDRGTFKSYSLGVRTISVGNLTTGGTGKTPLVIKIAAYLIGKGEKVCILTRGYGRDRPARRIVVSDGRSILADTSLGGDEPVEMARKLKGRAIIIADRDRVAAGLWAKDEFNVSVFILDDGFQHRRVKRDLDVVCIDSTRPCGNGRILPAGSLRESFRSLARADLIVLTRTDLVSKEEVAAITNRLRRRNNSAPIFEMKTAIRKINALEDHLAGRSTSDTEDDGRMKRSYFTFCGLGHPENFLATLEKNGIAVKGHRFFTDHASYSQSDIDRVVSEATNEGASYLITTAKDAVKLENLRFDLAVFVVEAESMINEKDAFERLITAS